MSFGDSLRAAREKRGLTQQQVADAMGLDKSTYCGYETGKRQPDVPKLKMLSRILGVSGDVLLETGYGERSTPVSESGPSDDDLIRLWKSLSPEEILRMRDFAQGLIASRKKPSSPPE